MKNKKKISLLKPLLLGVLGAFLIMAIVPRANTIMDLSLRKKELQNEKVELIMINENLKQEVEKMDSPQEIERIAREQLGMVKDGERVIFKVIKEE